MPTSLHPSQSTKLKGKQQPHSLRTQPPSPEAKHTMQGGGQGEPCPPNSFVRTVRAFKVLQKNRQRERRGTASNREVSRRPRRSRSSNTHSAAVHRGSFVSRSGLQLLGCQAQEQARCASVSAAGWRRSRLAPRSQRRLEQWTDLVVLGHEPVTVPRLARRRGHSGARQRSLSVLSGECRLSFGRRTLSCKR